MVIRVSLAAIILTTGLSAQTWDARSAAGYLDSRMEWWMGWSSAQRDHETFCISCHTVLPYALARPTLRTAVHETAASRYETKLLDNLTKRVKLWAEVKPFYPDSPKSPGKTVESRGTEAILNALVLLTNDPKDPNAKIALESMWAEQLKTGDAAGAWPWLQFHNAPWEGDSQYFGATMAALAVGLAPVEYRNPEGLTLLRDYLRRERQNQTLLDRVTLLRPASRLPGLLTGAEQKAIVEEVLGKQQDDGGFTLSTLVGAWQRKDKSPLDPRSDGYATGLITLALREVGISSTEPALRRSFAWLAGNQDKDGHWPGWSLNKERELSSDAGRFMSDAATAYAVLALALRD